MAAFNHDGSNKGVGMTEAKSDDSLAKRYKLSSTETRYSCKECGKQMINQSNLNAHIRSIHEGIKYPCGQCQYEATTKGDLARHRRAVHEGIKYPCGQCQHEATSVSYTHLTLPTNREV